MVILDNTTRWNSTFISLQRAFQLRKRLDHFWFDNKEALSKDSMSEDEWDEINLIVESLQPFYEVTLHLESHAARGRHGVIWEALPALEALQEAMEKGRLFWREKGGRKTHPLETSHQLAWEKLNKYYNLTDVAHGIYGAALLLHPSFRKHYFDSQWTSDTMVDWKGTLISNVKKIWQADYSQTSTTAVTLRHPPTLMQRFLQKSSVPQSGGDEFDSFICGPITSFGDDDNVISWILDSPSIPQSIKQQALDVLSIPATSAELERVFSQTKLTITPQRNRLAPETIETLELLRHWWVNNVIAQEKGGGGRLHRKRKILQALGEGEGEGDDEVIPRRGSGMDLPDLVRR